MSCLYGLMYMIYMDYKVDHIQILLVFATTDPTTMVPSNLLSSRSPSLLLTQLALAICVFQRYPELSTGKPKPILLQPYIKKINRSNPPPPLVFPIMITSPGSSDRKLKAFSCPSLPPIQLDSNFYTVTTSQSLLLLLLGLLANCPKSQEIPNWDVGE